MLGAIRNGVDRSTWRLPNGQMHTLASLGLSMGVGMAEKQIWDLWYPEAAAQGLPFARGRLDAATAVFVHAAPPVLDVAVRTDDEQQLAFGKGLKRTSDRPM